MEYFQITYFKWSIHLSSTYAPLAGAQKRKHPFSKTKKSWKFYFHVSFNMSIKFYSTLNVLRVWK